MIARGGEGKGKPEGVHKAVRELPNNLELEKAVLAVLLDGRHALAMQQARTVVEHTMAFFHRDHRMVYLACLELDDAGHRVDAQSVLELLSRYPFQAMLERLRQQQALFDAEQLDGLDRRRLRELYRRAPGEADADFADSAVAALGGPNAVFDLMQAFGPVAGFKRNVDLLWDYYLKRRLISRLSGLCDKAYRTPDEFPRLLDESNQAILDLNRMNRLATVHGIADVVDETIHRIVHQNENPEHALKSGIEGLDDKLVTLRAGGLYVLAARPGVGKTSFALKMVANIASSSDARQGVLLFSLEVDRIDLLKKLLAAETGVDFTALDTGLIKAEEMELVQQAGERLKGWHLHLMDVADLTVHALRSVVKRQVLEQQGNLKLVVLDYLQLLNSNRPDATEYEKVSEISRILKLLAMDLKIPVLALSQMSRDSERGTGSAPREPRLSDLRGSGSIEQDADAVIFMHRTDGGEGSREDEVRKIKVIVAKNRFGPTGSSGMDFYPSKMRFVPTRIEDEGGDGPPPEAAQRAYKAQQRRRSQDQPSTEEDQFGSTTERGGLF
jgi:replicative DNA helicase